MEGRSCTRCPEAHTHAVGGIWPARTHLRVAVGDCGLRWLMIGSLGKYPSLSRRRGSFCSSLMSDGRGPPWIETAIQLAVFFDLGEQRPHGCDAATVGSTDGLAVANGLGCGTARRDPVSWQRYDSGEQGGVPKTATGVAARAWFFVGRVQRYYLGGWRKQDKGKHPYLPVRRCTAEDFCSVRARVGTLPPI
jgi:hypothetical protein